MRVTLRGGPSLALAAVLAVVCGSVARVEAELWFGEVRTGAAWWELGDAFLRFLVPLGGVALGCELILGWGSKKLISCTISAMYVVRVHTEPGRFDLAIALSGAPLPARRERLHVELPAWSIDMRTLENLADAKS